MKGFLVVLVLIAVGIAGLGFYRGWFSVGSESGDGKSDITFSVDKERMQKDEKTVVTGVQKLGQPKKHESTTAERSTDGIVVRVSADELTMTTDGGKEQSLALAAGVPVTCDGLACKAADLKAGMRIRVTAEADAPRAASRIEALDKKATFAKAG